MIEDSAKTAVNTEQHVIDVTEGGAHEAVFTADDDKAFMMRGDEHMEEKALRMKQRRREHVQRWIAQNEATTATSQSKSKRQRQDEESSPLGVDF